MSRKVVSIGMRCELQALVFNSLVSGSEVLPREPVRELVVMPTCGERCLLMCLTLLLPFILSIIITPQSLYNLKWKKSLPQLLLLFHPEVHNLPSFLLKPGLMLPFS